MTENLDVKPPAGYALVRLLGRGGMGTVVQARQVETGRLVALKYLHLTTGNLRERFLREGRLASELVHPNIVQGLGIEFVGDAPVLVFEFVEGTDLRTYIEQRQKLAVPAALELVRPILSAPKPRDVWPELLDRLARAMGVTGAGSRFAALAAGSGEPPFVAERWFAETPPSVAQGTGRSGTGPARPWPGPPEPCRGTKISAERRLVRRNRLQEGMFGSEALSETDFLSLGRLATPRELGPSTSPCSLLSADVQGCPWRAGPLHQ